MVRTQIYLTERERHQLAVLAEQSGRSRSELIREAIDRYVVSRLGSERLPLLREARACGRSAPTFRTSPRCAASSTAPRADLGKLPMPHQLLVDTDIFVDYLHGQAAAATWLESQGGKVAARSGRAD